MGVSNRISRLVSGSLLLSALLASVPQAAEAQCTIKTAPAAFDPSPAAWSARPNSNLSPFPTSIAVSDGPAGKRLAVRWNYGFATYSLAGDPARPAFMSITDMWFGQGYPKNGDGSYRTGNLSSSGDGTRVIVPWTDDAGYGTVVELASGTLYGTAGDYLASTSLMADTSTAVVTYGGTRYLGFTLVAGNLRVADITSVRMQQNAGNPGSIPAESVPNVAPFASRSIVVAQGSGKAYLVINALGKIIVVDVSNPGAAVGSISSTFVASSFLPSDVYPAGAAAPSAFSSVSAAIHPVDGSLYIAVEGGAPTSQGMALARFDPGTRTLVRKGFFLPAAPYNVVTPAAAMIPMSTDVVAFFVSGGTTQKKIRALAAADFTKDVAPDALVDGGLPAETMTLLRGADPTVYLYTGGSVNAWSGSLDCTLQNTGAVPSIAVEKVPSSGATIPLAPGAQVFVGDEVNVYPRFSSSLPLTSWEIDADLHASETGTAGRFLLRPDLWSSAPGDVPPTSLKLIGPCDPSGTGGVALSPTPTDWSWCWTSVTQNSAQGGPDFAATDVAGTEKTLSLGFEAANSDNVNQINGVALSKLTTFDLRWRIPAVRAKNESILTGDVLTDGSEGSPLATGWQWFFASAPGGTTLAPDPACTGSTCAHVFPGNGTYAYHIKVPYRSGYSSPDCLKDANGNCTAPPAGISAFRTITMADVALAFTVPSGVYRSQNAIAAQSQSRKGAVSGTFSYQICASPCPALPTALPVPDTSISGDPFATVSPGTLTLSLPAKDGAYTLRIGYTYTGTTTCTTTSPCTVWWPSPSTDATTWAPVTISPVAPYIVLTGSVTQWQGDYSMFVGDSARAWAYVNGAVDPNPPAGLKWSFGNGQTSTVNGGTFSYSTAPANPFVVSLSGYGATQTVNVYVSPKSSGGGGGGGGSSSSTPPTVSSLSANPTNPAPNQAVTFSCNASPGDYSIASYTFSFGDGGQSGPAQSADASHTYANPGSFDVSCTVRDTQGKSAGRAITIAVGSSGGSCDFEITGSTGAKISFDPSTQFYDAAVGQPLTFTATGVSGAVTWNFGNGATAAGNPVTYSYPTASGLVTPFTVTLSSGGCTRSYSIFISGSAGPTPIDFRVLDDQTGVELSRTGLSYDAASGQRLRFASQNTTGTISWDFGDGTTAAVDQAVKWYLPLTDATYVVTLSANGQTKQRSVAVKGSTGAPLTGNYTFVYSDGTTVSRTAVQPNKSLRFTAADQADSYQWDFGDGSAIGQGSPIDHMFTKAGTFTVKVTASRTGLTPVTTPSPTQFTVLPPPDPLLWVAGGMAYVDGSKGELFQSDLSIFNPGTQSATASLAFVSGAEWVDYTKLTWTPVAIVAGGTEVFTNVLSTLFHMSKPAYGVVLVRGDVIQVAPVIVGRTYNAADPVAGTFGLSVPAMSVAGGVKPQSTAGGNFLVGLREDTSFRTNLTVANLKDETAEVSVVFRDAAGNVLGAPALVRVEARGVKQLNGALSAAPAGPDAAMGGAGWTNPTSNFSAEVKITKGSGVYPYATVIDQGTGDSVVVSPVSRPSATYRLPGIVRVPGKNGPYWVSDVALLNPSAKTRKVLVNFSYVKSGSTRRMEVSDAFTLAPYQMAVANDFVRTWLALPATDDGGYLSSFVDFTPAPDDPAPTEPILVGGKTYTPSGKGSIGLQVDPFTIDDGITQTSSRKRIVLSGLAVNANYRTNLALFLAPGATGSVQVNVRVLDGFGREVTRIDNVGLDTVTPFVQLGSDSLFPGLVTDDASRATIVIDSPRGSAVLAAYATVIDNRSEDATFIAGQPVP